MADANTQSKIDAAAEKAYAEAAATKTPAAKTAAKAPVAAKVAEAVNADGAKPKASTKAVKKAVAAPAKKAPVKKAPAKKAPAKTSTARKTTAKKAPAKRVAAKPAAKKTPATKAPAQKAAAKKAATPTTITKLKDTIMATAEKTEITAQAKEFAADLQTRAKTAYAKSGEFAGEVTEFNKANVDAIVESGKIFFEGAQELVKDNVETGKTVVETVTADAKKVAAVKSPTELMQLQGELARRNFDAVVAYGSNRTEAWVKLYNDAFAPISNRVSVAAEKISKAA